MAIVLSSAWFIFQVVKEVPSEENPHEFLLYRSTALQSKSEMTAQSPLRGAHLPFRLRIGCPAGPLVRPGETQPRKGCKRRARKLIGTQGWGTGAAGAACAAGGRPGPARQVPPGARPGLGLTPGSSRAPRGPGSAVAAPRSRSPSPSPSLWAGSAPPERAPGRCARRRSAYPPSSLPPSPPPRHLAPLGAAAARGSPSPSALPSLRAAPVGLAWLGLACGCSAGLGVSHPRRAERAGTRGRRRGRAASGGGGSTGSPPAHSHMLPSRSQLERRFLHSRRR